MQPHVVAAIGIAVLVTAILVVEHTDSSASQLRHGQLRAAQPPRRNPTFTLPRPDASKLRLFATRSGSDLSLRSALAVTAQANDLAMHDEESIDGSAADTTVAASSSSTGFALAGGLLVVTDETSAYRYIAAVLGPMFERGRPNADEVLLRVMAEQFPDVAWPPQSDTLAATQWNLLRGRVAAILDRHHPTPTPRLRVVK